MSHTYEHDESLKQLGFSSDDILTLKEKNYGMRIIQRMWNDYWDKLKEDNENRIQNEEDTIQLMEENKSKIAEQVMSKVNSSSNIRRFGDLDDFEETEDTPEEDNSGLMGGKKSKRKTTKSKRKTTKSKRKLSKKKNFKGGMCFGNGVGANSNDPNFSIYNTKLTQLFPYKPTN
jgi:hypothetical protein